ncbi:MAG: glycoside hydrolase family 16 protein [Bacteroidetes bacterium]|nr:glycoside hydrolase family 16 protein [Bacteroidota bacterium]MCL2302970.1 glycoside hydrolase family 16 protein [Lentimicrobiaceae bacterium]
MKKEIIIIVLAGLFIFPVSGQHPLQDKNWEPVFEDNFSTFNTKRWHEAYGAHSAGEANEGTTFRTYDNVYIENNKLVLRTQKQNSPPCIPLSGSCKYGGIHSYTAGEIVSNIRYGYGYFEIYAQLPGTTGYFPAFWLWYHKDDFATNNCWYNEIDIFEAYGSRPNTVESRAHWGFTCPAGIDDKSEIGLHVSNYSTGYHWYGLEWDSRKITWYVDRKPVRQMVNNMEGIGIQNPMYIIINIALAPDSQVDNPITSNTKFPNYMYIDQANVYRLKCDKYTVVNEIPNFNTYYYAVKKSITMSNATTIPVGSNISLRATDFIELKPGFEVQTGRELYLDATPCNDNNNYCVNYFTDQTITSNATVTGCDVLHVEDIEILNSATVAITAGEKISIKSGFRAAAGTNVKISIAP